MTFDPDSGLHLPVPDDDSDRRLQLLNDLGLDSPDEELDAFAGHLARDAGVPYAMVNVHTAGEQLFIGLHSPSDGSFPQVGRTMPLDHGYCPDVVTRELPLVLPNVMDFARFSGNPVVDQIGIQTYAGARLVIDGTVLGTLCFVGTAPLPQSTGRRSLALIKERRDELLGLLRRRPRR